MKPAEQTPEQKKSMAHNRRYDRALPERRKRGKQKHRKLKGRRDLYNWVYHGDDVGGF